MTIEGGKESLNINATENTTQAKEIDINAYSKKYCEILDKTKCKEIKDNAKDAMKKYVNIYKIEELSHKFFYGTPDPNLSPSDDFMQVEMDDYYAMKEYFEQEIKGEIQPGDTVFFIDHDGNHEQGEIKDIIIDKNGDIQVKITDTKDYRNRDKTQNVLPENILQINKWKKTALKVLENTGYKSISYKDISHTSLSKFIKNITGQEEISTQDITILKEYIETHSFSIGQRIEFSHAYHKYHESGMTYGVTYPSLKNNQRNIIRDIIINNDGRVQLDVFTYIGPGEKNGIHTTLYHYALVFPENAKKIEKR